MSNARFRGLGHVFSFTLGQMVKSRANIVSAVILLVMALVSVPLIQLTNGHGSVGPDVPAIVEQDGLTDAQCCSIRPGITVITDDIPPMSWMEPMTAWTASGCSMATPSS